MNRLMKMLALGGTLLLAVPGQALATKVVVDPGHGGKDPGALGINGLKEKDVALDIASRLRDELVRRGYEAVMTRTDDTYVSLADRVDFANRQGADLFVSVHANWYQNPNTKGTMVLYYDDSAPQADYPASEAMKALTPESRKLAQDVLNSFVSTVGTVNLGLTKSAVYVVRMGTIPSILVETAFLSNASDAALLADPGARQKMAVAIERGIEAYKPLVFPDLAGHWARDAVLRLKDRGIVEGVGTDFQPDRPMTRAEFVTMMDRAFKLPDPCGTAVGGGAAAGAANGGTVAGAVYGGAAAGGSGCGTGTGAGAVFADVTPQHWAYAALQKAAANGLLQGYPDGTLRPDSPLKRAEAAALLARFGGAALNAAQQPGTAAFADVPGTYWAAGDIAALACAGVVTGVKDGLFMPERLMTRAEMAVMLDRYLALRK
jgi:N-acetylmuramoyl-L-alanine amidase